MYTWDYIWSGSKEFDRLINSMANGNSKNWNKIMLLSAVCLCLHENSQVCQRSHFSYHTASRTHVTAKWRHHRFRVEIWNPAYLLKVTWLNSKLQWMWTFRGYNSRSSMCILCPPISRPVYHESHISAVLCSRTGWSGNYGPFQVCSSPCWSASSVLQIGSSQLCWFCLNVRMCFQ